MHRVGLWLSIRLLACCAQRSPSVHNQLPLSVEHVAQMKMHLHGHNLPMHSVSTHATHNSQMDFHHKCSRCLKQQLPTSTRPRPLSCSLQISKKSCQFCTYVCDMQQRSAQVVLLKCHLAQRAWRARRGRKFMLSRVRQQLHCVRLLLMQHLRHRLQVVQWLSSWVV